MKRSCPSWKPSVWPSNPWIAAMTSAIKCAPNNSHPQNSPSSKSALAPVSSIFKKPKIINKPKIFSSTSFPKEYPIISKCSIILSLLILKIYLLINKYNPPNPKYNPCTHKSCKCKIMYLIYKNSSSNNYNLKSIDIIIYL